MQLDFNKDIRLLFSIVDDDYYDIQKGTVKCTVRLNQILYEYGRW